MVRANDSQQRGRPDLQILILIVVALWWLLGDPKNDVAGWFWSAGAAPWEKVDAFYYPDRMDLRQHIMMPDLPSVERCQEWVYTQAAQRGDGGLTRGDYECGIGKVSNTYGLHVYRLTVR